MTSSLSSDVGQHLPNSPNQLLQSKSSYLLQHAFNPVNWYPWGDEALQKAKDENKLIFLSIGYSTCHWCHVMEKESFENHAIAKLMNENFVNIKVDREERPDIDKVYMLFVQAISGKGGWPMSIWMTPNLHPVYGGTYFPPGDRFYGMPGFPTILKSLAEQWKKNPEKFHSSGQEIVGVLSQYASVTGGSEFPSASICSELCFQHLQESYEPLYGGFSQSPKFPQPVNMSFLLRAHVRNKFNASDSQLALDMVLHTLRKIAKGGIHDHVGSGFARYSVDEKWHVPHFEKMLYDQAQMATLYSDAYLITKEEGFAVLVRDILSYSDNCLSDASGGFYCAEDADSYPEQGSKEKHEGAFYVWTYQEVQSLLSTAGSIPGSAATVADVICHHFDIRPDGNVDPSHDTHNELKGQNVLIIRESEDETAAKFGLSLGTLRDILTSALSTMQKARHQRPHPHLDDKMLVSWNGLMITAFAKAGSALKESSYVERAIKAAAFLRENLYLPETGRLLRCCYRGLEEGSVTQNMEPIHGFLDDYAFVIRGLLDLFTVCQDEQWIQWADQLQQKQDELFWDQSGGGYFTSEDSILVRIKEDQDGAEPSGNSVAVANLVRLSILLDKPEYYSKAGQILTLFSDRLAKIPASVPEMVSSLLMFEDLPTEVVIIGPRSSGESVKLLEEALLHRRSLLGQIVISFDPSENAKSFLSSRRPSMHSLKLLDSKPTAYLCKKRSCSAPVGSPSDLRQLLEK